MSPKQEPFATEAARLVARLVGSDPWLTKAEAITYTRFSARTIERAVVAGDLKAGGVNGKRAFRRSALDAWLTGCVLVTALLKLWIELGG